MRTDREAEDIARFKRISAEAALPWRDWFAWWPVQDWYTGNWFWLETIRYRRDYQTARWNYRART